MTNWVLVLAALAVILNVVAIGSGWTVLVRHPGYLRETAGQWFNLSPAYLTVTMIICTTSLSMFLAVLLAWWCLSPEIRSPSAPADAMRMVYHLATSIAFAVFHLLVAMSAPRVLGPSDGGSARDAAGIAKGAVRPV